MKKLIQWFKPSFEGGDSKSSFRRLSAFALLGLIIYNGIAGSITTMIGIYALAIYALTFLLLVGIITADNLMQVINDKKSSIKKETTVTESTEIQVKNQ